jgi:riboflavin synthase
MFTGIVEEVGAVRQLRGDTLQIEARTVLSDLKLGDSIAVDGTCLTVVGRDERCFLVNVQPETLRRTTIKGYEIGQRVNLERAVAVGGRLGGHLVQGHVDGTGRLIDLRPDGDGLVAKFQAPSALMRYIVAKGFIAVDGVSLTVVETNADWFTVALVRYTREHVALLDGGIGRRVNLEVDIFAKYIERLLEARAGGGAEVSFSLTVEKLREAGSAS